MKNGLITVLNHSNYFYSSPCNIFNARPCASFHSSRPFALRPSTTLAAVLGELKV
jgi:hypothetical protein